MEASEKLIIRLRTFPTYLRPEFKLMPNPPSIPPILHLKVDAQWIIVQPILVFTPKIEPKPVKE